MLRKIKAFFRENKFTKRIYWFLGSIKSPKNIKRKIRKRKALQENGIALVHLVQDLLCDEFFHFDMGTLLGIIREGKLLGHDLDVDIAVHLKDENDVSRIRQLLNDKGCRLVISYNIDGIGIIEDSFLVNGIKFDVSYYFEKQDKDVIYLTYKDPDNPREDELFNVVELATSPIKKIKQIDFNGKMINVPKDSEKYLSERYGSNWRIPDKNYLYWKGPSASLTDYLAKQEVF